MPKDNSRWRRQDARAIRHWRQLPESLRPRGAARELDETCRRHPLKITPHALALLKREVAGGPLRRMLLPDTRELRCAAGERDDPINDLGVFQPLPGLTHRHRNRVLIYPSMHCGGYCRYCFRRRRVGGGRRAWTDVQRRRVLDYIRARPAIREVILTGGDPLMLPDAALLSLLRRLRAIPHVRLLRLHTRMPFFNPARITARLADALAALQPLWVATHFNHPSELTAATCRHLRLLARRGVPLLNQSVLLKGVNDDAAVLDELSWRLAETGVRPYYLHHPDPARGTRHFRTSLAAGRDIRRALWRSLPGYLAPQYVLDMPGGGGKLPLT